MDPRAEVRNAADPQQVRGAARRESDRKARFLGAVREVLATDAGRILFGERTLGLIARAGVYRSIWTPSAQIHYNAGKQDYGHELIALLLQADEALYVQMETEMRQLAKRDAHERDAANTPRASITGATNG